MNRKVIFASLALAIALNIAIIGCHRKGDNENTQSADSLRAMHEMEEEFPPPPDSTAKNPFEGSVIEVKTFKNDSVLKGYGYDIYVDNSLKVHQPHIPAVS